MQVDWLVRREDTGAQKSESSAAIHDALDHFKFANLSFDGTGGPRRRQRVFDAHEVAPEAHDEIRRRGSRADISRLSMLAFVSLRRSRPEFASDLALTSGDGRNQKWIFHLRYIVYFGSRVNTGRIHNMTIPGESFAARPHLYHALSSYYSMIARLSLIEGKMPHDRTIVDIHLRLGQQHPDYVRLNPNMTVPTLVLADGVLTESRDIANYALGVHKLEADEETRSWLDLHYDLPIEELTFGLLLAHNKAARLMVPKALGRARRSLLAHARRNPELAPLYERRAGIFSDRINTFEPGLATQLAKRRLAQALDICEIMERTLSDGRPTLVAAGYGAADVVMTVFLGRIEFVGLREELARRSTLTRYWRAMQLRPSFGQADIWTSFHPWRLIGGIIGISSNSTKSH